MASAEPSSADCNAELVARYAIIVAAVSGAIPTNNNKLINLDFKLMFDSLKFFMAKRPIGFLGEEIFARHGVIIRPSREMVGK